MNDDTLALLERFSAAWNAHDVDAILACMTDDCIYLAAAGETSEGTKFVGKPAVGAAFVEIWTRVPDAEWADASHFCEGDTALSKWLFRGTASGSERPVETMGLDVFKLRDGLIAIKDTYRKTVTR